MYFNPRFPRGKRLNDRINGINSAAISIHASRGGSDRRRPGRPSGTGNFNPRFPRGKRLKTAVTFPLISSFQSTLPAGEATQAASATRPGIPISIHASRGGSDPTKSAPCSTTTTFQSTLPAGEATRYFPSHSGNSMHFNPRFPRGKRQ